MNWPLLTRLAWRNLWRHGRRTSLILVAISLGVWSMVFLAALSRGSMEQQIRHSIFNLLGHIQIHAPNYRDDPVIEHRMAAPDRALLVALDGPEIRAWSSRVRVPAVVASERESAGVVVVGIDPDGERDLSFIPQAVRLGDYLDDDTDPGILIGRKLADRLETELGRRIVILSQDVDNTIADRGFRVKGIFHADVPNAESNFVFIGRRVAQDMLKLGDHISEIAVLTDDRTALAAPLGRLRAAAPDLDVQAWTVVEPLLVLTAEITDVILLIWFAIVFLAMSFGLVNTLLMAIFERTREIGLFQALGMQPRYILMQILLESLCLLVLGLLIGNALAFLNLWWLRDGLDLSAFAEGLAMVGVSPVIFPLLTYQDIVTANLLVLVLGAVASLYPAWRAARRVPMAAITRG